MKMLEKIIIENHDDEHTNECEWELNENEEPIRKKKHIFEKMKFFQNRDSYPK
jgi:hypothetical protein